MRLVHGAAAALALALMMPGVGGPAVAEVLSIAPSPAAYHFGPPAPDCRALAASHGSQRLWFGAISGTRFNQFFDISNPHYAQGCFVSEHACRRWLHENLSYMEGGSLNWMRCEPGVPARALY
ncbi:MAG TPA: hypothetical protein VHG92_06880 [Afifellaceae bacterium]|nr:hypothetical protein [Afifellaceae bacterium]